MRSSLWSSVAWPSFIRRGRVRQTKNWGWTDDHRSVPVGLSVGALPHHQGGGEDAHAARRVLSTSRTAINQWWIVATKYSRIANGLDRCHLSARFCGSPAIRLDESGKTQWSSSPTTCRFRPPPSARSTKAAGRWNSSSSGSSSIFDVTWQDLRFWIAVSATRCVSTPRPGRLALHIDTPHIWTSMIVRQIANICQATWNRHRSADKDGNSDLQILFDLAERHRIRQPRHP